VHVIVHGHFYQPPRENPWSGLLSRQVSAAPAHDWNVRIADECYRPNARSRLLGEGNLIEEICNNYAFVNFDFGPTLLTWLERNSPEAYEHILEGDRLSLKLQEGHGNAIAQVYNHVIMPLANYRDKRTQIAWGLRDFEWRFGRKSESIWLAETACNLDTVKLLIEFDIRYLILSPYQALRTRPLDRSKGWTDGSGGKIDPRKPYRFFLKDARRRRLKDRYIDIFFYDGPLASDVSFNHLLQSAPKFRERLVQAGGGMAHGDGVVNVATDGEVYGHHEPFGDMCLAYLVRRDGPQSGLEFTNYGRYLDLHPPTEEVDLNFGDHDEGTAWSCAHGVGRWERDCGCETGGQPGWNQRWRTPLRRGLDVVRDRIIETYLEQVSPLVDDPWTTRDDYILVLLDQSESARNAFIGQHARRDLTKPERQKLWSLLESQRFSMYMFTSCAWFFSDVSGIETVQNMAYACRAIELAKPWQSFDLESMLLEYLSEAQSNVPAMGTGADIYRRFARPQRIRPERVAGGMALGAAVAGEEPSGVQLRYEATTLAFSRSQTEDEEGQEGTIHRSLLRLTQQDTETEHLYRVHVFSFGSGGIRCYVLPADDGEATAADPHPPSSQSESALQAEDAVRRYTLRNLVAEGRDQIIKAAYESILAKQDQQLAELYAQGKDLIATCRRAGVEVPGVLLAAAGHVLERMLGEKAEGLAVSFTRRHAGDRDPEGGNGHEQLLEEIGEILAFARRNEIEVSISPLVEAYSRILTGLLESFVQDPLPEVAENCLDVIKSSYGLEFPLDRRPLEELAFLGFGKHREVLGACARDDDDGRASGWKIYRALAEALRINIDWILAQDGGGGARPASS